MARMTKAELGRVVDEAIEQSTWRNGSAYHAAQTQALDDYYGRKPAKQTDGLSGATSTDFADTVESTVAAIEPAFDFDQVAVFEPNGGGDVNAARTESAICNRLLRSRAGSTVMQEAVRNALMLRNAILKVWPDEQVDVRTRRYTNLDPLELAAATEPTAPDQIVDVVSFETHDDGTMDASVKKTTRFRRLDIVSVDPVQFVITEDWDEQNLRNVPLVGEHYFLSRSDLIARGIAKATVKKLPANGATDDNLATASRNRGETGVFTNQQTADPAMQMVECFELYMLVDADGDGIAERRRLLRAGGVIVQNWPQAVQPYASGVAFLQPQRWLGVSLWDKLHDLESVKTETLRQYLDNMAYANNSEVLAVDGAVEMDDLKARRPGGINRVDDIGAVRELVVGDHGPSSLALLNYMDRVRSERVGSSLEISAHAELSVAADTAHGAEREYTAREAISRMITKTIGETLVRQTFMLIHQTIRQDFPTEDAFTVDGYSPADWPLRQDVEIIAGKSLHERSERRGALESVLIQQEKLFAAGLGSGILADMLTYHNALVDWTAAGGVQNSRRYWIDPRSEESVQAQQAAQQQAQQQAAAQAAQQTEILQTQVGITQDRLTFDVLNAESQLRFDYWKTVLDSAQQEQQTDAQYGSDNAEPDQVDALQEVGEAAA